MSEEPGRSRSPRPIKCDRCGRFIATAYAARFAWFAYEEQATCPGCRQVSAPARGK